LSQVKIIAKNLTGEFWYALVWLNSRKQYCPSFLLIGRPKSPRSGRQLENLLLMRSYYAGDQHGVRRLPWLLNSIPLRRRENYIDDELQLEPLTTVGWILQRLSGNFYETHKGSAFRPLAERITSLSKLKHSDMFPHQSSRLC
jgi:hypothetical protein